MCAWTHMHAWMHTHACVHTHKHTHAHTHTHTPACMHACTHTYTHISAHTHACIHTYKHTGKKLKTGNCCAALQHHSQYHPSETALKLEPSSTTYRIPMPVTDTRVADGVQDRQVVLELVNLCLDILRNAAWAVLVTEGLSQLVHRAPHVIDLLVNLLSIQGLERTCAVKPKVNYPALNLHRTSQNSFWSTSSAEKTLKRLRQCSCGPFLTSLVTAGHKIESEIEDRTDLGSFFSELGLSGAWDWDWGWIVGLCVQMTEQPQMLIKKCKSHEYQYCCIQICFPNS